MKYTIAPLLVLLSALIASAEPVAVGNHSFELPDLPLESGATWTNTYDNWDTPDAEGDAFVEMIDGFFTDGEQHIGMQNGINGEVSQAVGLLSPNTIYTLTVDVGKRNENFNPADGTNWAEFGLYVGADRQAGGTKLATTLVDPSALDDGAFMLDQTLSYTTGDTVPAGDLYISLALADGASGRAHYDNIRLDASAVPEPAAGLLAMMGALAGMTLRRRTK